MLKDLGSTLSPEAQAELAPQEAKQEMSEGDILAQLIATIENVNTAFAVVQAENRKMKAQISMLEMHMDYLLSKDPEFQAAFKKAQEAAAAAEQASGDTPSGS